jgi:hypothetical protein
MDRVDLSVELEDPADLGESERHSWKSAAQEASMRSAFGWGHDYLDRVNDPRTEVTVAKPMSSVVTYLTYRYDPYALHDVGVWEIEHRYPRFTAVEPFVFRFGEKRVSGFDELQLNPAELRQTFEENRQSWLINSLNISSVTQMVLLPEYQRIIGLGWPVVPLIIEELRHDVDQWFWALTAIVGEDKAAGAQNFQEAADRWIAWYDSLVPND